MFDKKKDDNSKEEKSVSDVFRLLKVMLRLLLEMVFLSLVKLKKQMRYKLMVRLM